MTPPNPPPNLACESVADGYVESAQDRSGSATIPLHAGHPRLGLDGEAARVVHNTLTHPGNGALSRGKYV